MEIKALKAIEEFNATFVTHYKSLLNKFTLLDKEYSEFKSKLESLNASKPLCAWINLPLLQFLSLRYMPSPFVI